MMKKKLNRYLIAGCIITGIIVLWILVGLIAGCIITGIIVLWILVGHFYTPYPPTKMSSAKLQAPSAAHLFGTDKFGRDIFSRVMQGSGTTLMIAALTILIGAGVGTVVGAVTGYFGGIVDEVLMRTGQVQCDHCSGDRFCPQLRAHDENGFRRAERRELYYQREADGSVEPEDPFDPHAAQYAACAAPGADDRF